MKRWFTILLCLLCLSHAACAEVSTSASAAVLMDAASGRVLYSHNPDEVRPMASTTKIMTGLLAVERLKMDEIVTVSPKAVGVEGSSLYLEPYERLTAKDLCYGLLLKSGNDAAAALACHIAGSEAAFATLMNEKARAIGAKHTHFCNPHGLEAEGHATTAYDLALIARAAMQHDTFAEIVATKETTIPFESQPWDRYLKNHNRLLLQYEGCDGVKTGYTKAAGRCLVSSATRDGRRLIAVTLNDGDDWADHTAMLDYGFSAFSSYTVCSEGAPLGTASVADAAGSEVRLACGETFVMSLQKGEESHLETTLKVGAVCAPVKRGDVLGELVISLYGEPIATAPVVAKSSVARVTFRTTVLKILRQLCLPD